jgi:hypothetical protein
MKTPAALALLVVAACGAAPAVSQTTPSTNQPQATTSRQVRAAVSPSAQAGGGGALQQPTPAAAPSSVLAVMVDLFAGGNAYDIALVAVDGRVVARAHAQKRTAIADASELPYVSASNSRVYYLDGDRDIRYLKADGSSSLVTSVPGSATVHAAFAVTPDDARIAVGLLDYSVNPVALTLYVEDVGGAHHSVIFTSTSKYVWPAGWHAGQLVVAYLGPSGTPFNSVMANVNYSGRDLRFYPYGPNPFGGINYHVINPVTAQREAIISGGGASGLPNKVGTAVVQGDAVDWNGQPLFWNSPQDYGSFSASGSLSPDGRIIAACCAAPNSAGQLVLWYQGGDSTVLPVNVTAVDWVGWFDNAHLVTGFYQRADGTPSVVDINSNQVRTVDAHGIVAAMLPGSLD